MRAPAVSFAKRFAAALMAALLTFALLPANAFAEGEGVVNTSAEGIQEADSGQADEAAEASPRRVVAESQGLSAPLALPDLGSTPAASSAEAGTLAASLIGKPASFVNADVVLDGDPIVGSFTVDGLTFAVTEDSNAELVGVSNPEVIGSTPAASEAEADSSIFILPESVAYNDVEYAATSIGAYAFYLSGVTAVELPASVIDVDDRAFRSSDVASVEVAEGNSNYSSFDGALYDADQLSLLLIPEGKQGTVLLPKEAESASPSAFSHCPLVTQVSVEEGSAAFASENGLLYDVSLETLLRVPAGATDITIREGCTTIAAGAMEACASLTTITAPASVTSISPDVFTSVPTISLPAAALAEDAPQLSAMVALNSIDDDLPNVDASSIVVVVPNDSDERGWRRLGMALEVLSKDDERYAQASTQTANSYSTFSLSIYANKPATLRYQPKKAPDDNDGIAFIREADWDSPSVTNNVVMWRPQGGYGYIQIFYGSTATWYNTYISAEGYSIDGHYTDAAMLPSQKPAIGSSNTTTAVYIKLTPIAYSISYDLGEGGVQAEGNPVSYTIEDTFTLKEPTKPGYVFLGWSGSDIEGISKDVTVSQGTGNRSYEANWLLADYGLSFDTSSEPGDEDYPGIEKPDETVNVNNGPTVIEDPKRPGYVFQGWTIPNAEGTEAIDQELVYKDETDGKWYVDASKLPDYANDDGRVELTARWTSVISVDVPSAVTFYADVVTQGNESREGAASSAFGQNKVASQSQVDLRIVGLESSAVETQGSTLGADSILKKATSATSSSSTQKLFSLYPTDAALTAGDLQDPDAVSTDKPDGAVDFALDDLLLEGSFAADKFTIPAGDTLNLGYRLNLQETGTELDYDTLSTLEEGQSASIANINYTFAADALPSDWGEPLWIENPDQTLNPAKYLLLDDIKEAAEDLSANGTSSVYYDMYKGMLDRQIMNGGNPGEGPYFQLKVDEVYLPLQLIGICQDIKSDGSCKVGLTFQTRDLFSFGSAICYPGSGGYASHMNSSPVNTGGWASCEQRTLLQTTFYGYLDVRMQPAIEEVVKYQQPPSGTTAAYLHRTDETVWLPSMREVFGTTFDLYNEAEGPGTSYEPFQYMAYEGNGGNATNTHAVKKARMDDSTSVASVWWLRSAYRGYSASFCDVDQNGMRSQGYANNLIGIAPAFCL